VVNRVAVNTIVKDERTKGQTMISLLVFKIELKRRNRHRTVLVVTSHIDRGLETYQS
jgi:hypothetical protein